MTAPTQSKKRLPDVKTLPELLCWRVAESPEADAYQEFDNSSASWKRTTWAEVGNRVAAFINALAALKLERGARIAILLPNCLDAVCVDQATLAIASVPVPMHALDNAESIAYILKDSDASVLVAQTDEQWRAIDASGLTLSALKLVVIRDKMTVTGGLADDHAVPVISLADWLASPKNVPHTPLHPVESDLAALVYTSGTTGKPKGVMLTHANVVSNVLTCAERVVLNVSDLYLSFLPLSHTFERTTGYYLAIAAGACVAYSRSTKQIPQDLLDVRPTILISVPRIYERVYSVVQTSLASSKIKSVLFNAAIDVGWRRFCRTQGTLSGDGLLAAFDHLAWSILEPLVARKLTDQFGGRLRIAISGGAALSQTISRCFLGLGIPITQGYGMTETSPVVAFNSSDDNDPSTVGRVMAGVEVRIGENAELQVRGPNVMRGYWKREEDTAKTFVDGWLRTGDQASIEGGRVRILGRIKEIIVTSTGEKIAPVDLELAILNDANFEQAYVFGENRPFIGCAVVLAKPYWSELANMAGVDQNDSNALTSDKVVGVVLRRIRELTQSFPYYAQPRAVIVSLEPWTIENTLITPTLKLKRNNLNAHFNIQIESMYNHGSTGTPEK